MVYFGEDQSLAQVASVFFLAKLLLRQLVKLATALMEAEVQTCQDDV